MMIVVVVKNNNYIYNVFEIIKKKPIKKTPQNKYSWLDIIFKKERHGNLKKNNVQKQNKKTKRKIKRKRKQNKKN